MMTRRGHTVYVYAPGDGTDAECEEFISCAEGPADATVVEPQWTREYFQPMNDRVILEMRDRIEPHDFICAIAGDPCHVAIAEAFPHNMTVEYGVGYQGTFSPYRCFESYAWMHMVYGWERGRTNQGAMDCPGRFYDAVIPNYFEVDQFPAGNGEGDYLLFMGRLIELKGIQIAVDTSKRTGLPLVIAGQGTPPDHGDYVGVVGPEQRAALMGCARALVAPTLYTGPFEGVVVEAQLCGTPVITTDWGAFAETVEDGVTGYRCRTMAEFERAAGDVKGLDRAYIRDRAIRLYSTERVAVMYERYFERLMGLWGEGFTARRELVAA